MSAAAAASAASGAAAGRKAFKHEWYRKDEHWGCDAYDHGPFCRQCVLISDRAVHIVNRVWNNLMGRSGFGSALDDAPQGAEDEIKADLVLIVRRLL